MSSGGKVTAFLVFQFGVVLVVLLVTALRPGPWDGIRVIGFLIALFGTVMLFLARYQIGDSFTVSPQARRLVTHGVYSRIRNPIYVFGPILIAGLALYWNRSYFLWAFAFLIPMQAWRARKEARVLEVKFGEDYRTYRRQTWF